MPSALPDEGIKKGIEFVMVSNKFIQRLLKACQVVVLTGSALKAKSVSGNLFSAEKLSFKEQRDRSAKTFWHTVQEARAQYRELKPNLGHYALVDLENRFEDFALITTAIDGLHKKAGNNHIIELRGNVFQNRCGQCNTVFESNGSSDIPVCPQCGSEDILPNVLGEEDLPQAEKLKEAQRLAAEAEVFITAGFNDMNRDIQALPFIARANGAYLLELTAGKSAFTTAMDETIIGNPAKYLTAIVLLLEKI